MAKNEYVDALMLRYNMSHRIAAEKISLPMAQQMSKPVIAFTTTRWNALQQQRGMTDSHSPSTRDCLSFALSATDGIIQYVLHSARDESELIESMDGLTNEMSPEDIQKWKAYGASELDWNDLDGFDEYPYETRDNRD